MGIMRELTFEETKFVGGGLRDPNTRNPYELTMWDYDTQPPPDKTSGGGAPSGGGPSGGGGPGGGGGSPAPTRTPEDLDKMKVEDKKKLRVYAEGERTNEDGKKKDTIKVGIEFTWEF